MSLSPASTIKCHLRASPNLYGKAASLLLQSFEGLCSIAWFYQTFRERCGALPRLPLLTCWWAWSYALILKFLTLILIFMSFQLGALSVTRRFWSLFHWFALGDLSFAHLSRPFAWASPSWAALIHPQKPAFVSLTPHFTLLADQSQLLIHRILGKDLYFFAFFAWIDRQRFCLCNWIVQSHWILVMSAVSFTSLSSYLFSK